MNLITNKTTQYNPRRITPNFFAPHSIFCDCSVDYYVSYHITKNIHTLLNSTPSATDRTFVFLSANMHRATTILRVTIKSQEIMGFDGAVVYIGGMTQYSVYT